MNNGSHYLGRAQNVSGGRLLARGLAVRACRRTVPAPGPSTGSPAGATTRPIGRSPVEHHVHHRRILPAELYHDLLRPFRSSAPEATGRPAAYD